MNKILLLALSLVLSGWSSCNTLPKPAPGPTPVVADAAPPKRAPDDPCAAWCAHLHALDCPSWSATCVSNCVDVDTLLIRLHSAPLDYTCGINAPDCAAARACGGGKK